MGSRRGTTELKGMGEPTVDYEGPNQTKNDLRALVANPPTGLPKSSIDKADKILNEMETHGLPFRDAVLATKVEADSSGYTGGLDHLVKHLGGKFVKNPATEKVHAIPITPAMRLSVMKEGQPIAKKEEKKRPFAAPETNVEAANISPRLRNRMQSALA